MFNVPIWPRVKLGPGEKWSGVCLIDRLLGIETHFTAVGYMPCLRMFGGDCPHHQPNGRRLIWMAPTPCWDDKKAQVVLCQISAGAVALLPGVKRRTDLYGRQLTYSRQVNTRSALCRLQVGLAQSNVIRANDGKAIEHAQIWQYLSQHWGFELVPSSSAAPAP